MASWESGRVVEVGRGWTGVARVRVALDAARDAADAANGGIDGGEIVPALAYTALTGTPAVGERVIVNAEALRSGLGTGGDAMVIARPDADPASAPRSDHPGHLVKARYMPQQLIVDAIDDPRSPHYDVMRESDDLEGMPVVVSDLHSALPAIVAGMRADRPDARIVYVMTDSAAMPAAYSRTVDQLRTHGLLDACISTGQAFGGDAEAVSVHSGLIAARHVLEADAVVALQGPGNLGSGTPFGFSGVQAAEVIHATAALEGRPVAAVRVSNADERGRHAGLSHHTSTVLGRLVHTPADIAVPTEWDSLNSASFERQLESAVLAPARARGVRHRRVDVEADGLREALEALPVRLSTMGRGLDSEPDAFLAAAAAGRAAMAAQS